MTAIAIDLLVNATTSQASKNIKTLTGNVDDLGDEVERTNQKMAGLGKGIKVGLAAAGVAAAAGVVAVGAALGSSVKAGADAEAMMGKFNVVFGDTAGTAEKVTSELDAFARQAGRNKYMLREMASGFGDVLKPLGFSVTEAGDLSTEMTQLAIDLGSFNDMAPEQAFERLSSTLIGNHANALAFGVVINEAVLKEELAAMGADELTGSLLEQAKVQARINLLLKGTTDAQGDAINTSHEWNNQMIALKSKLEEVRTEIGMKLLPVLSPFLEAIGELAGELLPKAAEAFAGFVDQIDVEKLKTDLKTFVDELLEGDFVLGPIEIQFEKPGQEGPMWERQFLPDETTLIDLADHFTWDSQKWLDENLKESTLTIGGKVLFGEEAGDLVIETATVNDIVVSRKITFGDIMASEWTNEDGWLLLKVGGVEFGPEFLSKFQTGLKWAIQGAFVLATAGGSVGLAIRLPTAEEFASFIQKIDDANEAVIASIANVAVLTGEKIGQAFQAAVDASMGWLVRLLTPGSGKKDNGWLNPEWGESQDRSELEASITAMFSNFQWSDHIEKFTTDRWSEFVEGLEWVTYIHEKLFWRAFIPFDLSWGAFVDEINWRDYLPPWMGGGSSEGGEDNPPGTGTQNGAGNPRQMEGDQGGGSGRGFATGTGYFPGGGTWVGETGPEFIMAPRGASIFPAGPASMAAAGGGGPTINIQATIANEFDAHVLAREVAQIIKRGGM